MEAKRITKQLNITIDYTPNGSNGEIWQLHIKVNDNDIMYAPKFKSKDLTINEILQEIKEAIETA